MCMIDNLKKKEFPIKIEMLLLVHLNIFFFFLVRVSIYITNMDEDNVQIWISCKQLHNVA